MKGEMGGCLRGLMGGWREGGGDVEMVCFGGLVSAARVGGGGYEKGFDGMLFRRAG